MKENYKVKQLEKDNVKSFVRIIRESFQSQHLVPSIYRGKGIERFILNELDNAFSPYRYFVAYNSSQIVGCAEFKVISGSDIFFLNQIAAKKEFKGRGIGKAIMNFTINFYAGLGYKNLQLDVYQDNNVALDWYSEMGFKQLDHKLLCEIKTSILNFKEKNIYIQNFPQYKVIKDKYGFNYLDVMIDNELMRIGVIEDDLIFRGEYSDSIKIVAKQLYDKLHFENIFFIGKDKMRNNEELILLNKIIRMELKIQI